jgi:hypothetical protein
MARRIASSTPVSLLPTISLSRYTWLLIGVLPIGHGQRASSSTRPARGPVRRDTASTDEALPPVDPIATFQVRCRTPHIGAGIGELVA